LDPKYIEAVISCNGGDFASSGIEPKFRWVARCIIRMKDGKAYTHANSVADVLTKKDSSVVLENTILKYMVDGMNSIAKGTLIFKADGEVKLEDATVAAAQQAMLQLLEHNNPQVILMLPPPVHRNPKVTMLLQIQSFGQFNH